MTKSKLEQQTYQELPDDIKELKKWIMDIREALASIISNAARNGERPALIMDLMGNDHIGADRYIMKKILSHAGEYLEFAYHLHNDKEMVMEAVKEDKNALKFAEEELQKDPDIRKAAGLED